MPCACGVRGASAACDGFGFARKTAAPFDVFYWLQVTNFDVLFDSASPKGANHFDVWDFGIHAKMASRLDRFDWFLGCLLCNRNFGEFIAYPNIGNRRATGYRTKVPYTTVGSADKILLDYVTRRFNALSAGLKNRWGLNLR
jgi:hypothetical protein